MARPKTMSGPPTERDEDIRQAAGEYRELQTTLVGKRSEQKSIKDGLNEWRNRWAERAVKPSVLKEAMDLTLQAEMDPTKAAENWRLLTVYLKALGFFDLLPADLFDGHHDPATERRVRLAAG